MLAPLFLAPKGTHPHAKATHPFLPAHLSHADGCFYTRTDIEASLIHEGGLILIVDHHAGSCHCGQYWDKVILLSADHQREAYGKNRKSRVGMVGDCGRFIYLFN